MNDTKEAVILVDLYAGAYGPTIRIILNTRQQLESFLDKLRSLASNEDVTIALEQLSNFALSGIGSFVLQTVPSIPALPKHLTVSGDHNPSIVWKQTRQEWKRAAGLIEVFTTSDEAGHHYLTDEGIDDALVEVAYQE
ncbi:MAG TPA: hypothetical protein VJS17_09050 [Pyrinomonadaceae bacterium]|nr:hypothetical protein [Pyrinomonadaceae bacterium]